MSTKQNLDQDVCAHLRQIESRLDDIASRDAMLRLPVSAFHPQVNRQEEIDLREIWDVIWHGKWIIISITFVFALASMAYALSLPNIYRSEALLAPAEENSGGGLAGLAGQFGGLASLAGVNIGAGGSDKTTLAMEVLKSRDFISKFIQKHNLLVPLIAAKGWDRSLEKLVIDQDVYDVKSQTWVRDPTPLRKAEPSAQEAYTQFMEFFSISQDKASNFVVVGMEFYSPDIAKQWVDLLIRDINLEIKSRDVNEATKSIKYLNEQLVKTPVMDMKTIFYELIEEQLKIVMFAEVRDEYVFKTIDEAVVPEKKAGPKRALICMAGTILGGIVGLMVVFLRYFLRESEKS